MFNRGYDQEEIKFKSNPPLPERPSIVAERDNRGNFKNAVKMVPGDNRSFFDGVHFSRETMSLRAKLNLGVKFTQVSFGQLENDPTVLRNSAIQMETQILSRLDQIGRESISEVIPESTPESTPDSSLETIV